MALSLSVLLATTAVCPSLAGEPWPALEPADWSAYSYEIQADEGQGDMVLLAEVKAAGKRPHGRLVFNMVDGANYDVVDLAAGAVRVLRVESGLELPLGASYGPGLRGSKWQELLVRRQGAGITVFLGGRLVARAADSTFIGGKTALGATDGSVQFRDLLLQETVPVLLQDDFMRAEEETGGWETVRGEWKIQSIGSPVRSSNAFNTTVESAPKGALSVCGEWFWSGYAASVSCQPHGEGQVGLVAYYTSPADYYMFALGQAKPRAESTASLVRIQQGKVKPLASEPWPLMPDQWHRLELRVAGDRLTALVDGMPAVSVETEALPGGQAGLYVKGQEGATFDDFSAVRSETLSAGVPALAEWSPVGGEWVAEGEQALRGVSASDAKLLFDQELRGDVAVRATIEWDGAGEVGLVTDWEDDGNCRMLTYGGEPATLRLVSIRDGEATELASAPVEPNARPVELRLEQFGRCMVARATGATELVAVAPEAPRGRAGLLVRDGEATFTSAFLERLPALPAVVHFESAFEQEVSMADWAAGNSDWVTVDAQAGDPGPSYWHRAPAYAGHEISVSLNATPSGPVAAMAAASAPGAVDGYRLTITPGRATLQRAGAEVAATDVPGLPAEAIRRVSLQKRGPLVLGSVNGRVAVTFIDPEPLTGLLAGWVAPPGCAEPSDATFRAENVLSYSFRRAPGDWWVGSGDWKITNRWDCEPRWTFFVGGGAGAACLWNKREFGDNVTLDFYGAIRFDSTKGYNYPHAANINCTIAADGRDLSSGYSFIYGGWDNQYTRLLRGDEVVAETTGHLITRSSGIHRQWFNLRVRKSGGAIECWLDGAKILEYNDPEPLTGKHVALWTYDNAITLARVRIASDSVRPGALPPPDTAPRCAYDNPALGATDG